MCQTLSYAILATVCCFQSVSLCPEDADVHHPVRRWQRLPFNSRRRYTGGMDENPYQAPIETSPARKTRFPAWKWYGVMAAISIATFAILWACAVFFGRE